MKNEFHPAVAAMARIFAVAGMVAIVIATTVAEAGLSINAVTVDGKAIPIPAGSGTGSGTREPLRIPSTAGRVVLAFEGDSAATIPPDDEQTSSSPSGTGTPPHPRDSRLCYRLDGFDASWRDIPATGRMSLGFEDEERGLIDRVEVELAGESPGWNGDVQTAPLVAGRASAVVPPTAVGLRANLISSYFGSAVGVVALDDVRFLIEHADGRHSEQAVAVDLGESPSLDRLPRNWTKSGTKLAMSRLVMRRSPEPHPILTIIDDEPVRYGSWMHGPKIAIAPGDRVTLTWSAAWSSGSGGEATADYENLKPGTDFFRVGAFYPNGEPTGVEAVMPIEVYVPFHLRRDVWAGAAVIGLACAVTAGRAANVRRMKRRLADIEREHALERERARIARDLHDDVGAGLTEIAVQTDWIRRDMERIAEDSPRGREAEMLSRSERVCQSAVELIRSVDAIVWAVNPKNDTLDRFVGYLTSSAEQFTGAAGIRLRFDVPDEIPPLPLAGRTRHDLYLIVREAINNAVKHAQATAISLCVTIDRDTLRIAVEDDGQGFDPESRADDGRHAGLANMRRRAEDLGGRLTITSRPGGGTRVEITASLA